MSEAYQFPVNSPGERLDKFVSLRCPEFSRTHIQKLIVEGHITVNGRAAKSGLKLDAADVVKVVVPAPATGMLLPEAIPLKVVYEDDDLLVVDKPAGLSVHPAPGHESGTLVNAILARYPGWTEFGDSLRPGIVHRLDKDTSGLLIVARKRTAQENLVEQFRRRTVNKSYLVLVRGKLTPERGAIEADIGRDRVHRQRMAVVTEGREARTRYKVLKYLGEYTLLEVKPETGRTHQIRVHLGAIGFPVVGDATYGVKSPYLRRQFLHACRLGFRLPSNGEYVEFTSGLPEDLKQALEKIA